MLEHDLILTMSDLCLLMGVSQQAIRMYEKKGALPNVKDEKNGYRYYLISRSCSAAYNCAITSNWAYPYGKRQKLSPAPT
ncbi:MAG: MerR family DNA-binding transcriptional regulator [Clostridiales bacterium]|nr:MerR family DNA-binding transcriptional regulator [Clostridiales bacterium]